MTCDVCGMSGAHASTLGCIAALQARIAVLETERDEAHASGYGVGWDAGQRAIRDEIGCK